MHRQVAQKATITLKRLVKNLMFLKKKKTKKEIEHQTSIIKINFSQTFHRVHRLSNQMQPRMSQSTHHLQANISLNPDFPKVDQQFRLQHIHRQATHHSYHIIAETAYNSICQLPFQFSPPQPEQALMISVLQKSHSSNCHLPFQFTVVVVTPFMNNLVSKTLNLHQLPQSFTLCCHLEIHTPQWSMNLTHRIMLHHKFFTIQCHRPQAM